MANIEQRIAELERQVSEMTLTIQSQTTTIDELNERIQKESGYAYALVYDKEDLRYKIYLPYGALTINSSICPIEDTIGWFPLPGVGPVYVNIYRSDLKYYAKIGNEMDDKAVFYFCVGNVISENRIERFINGGVVLVLNDEVRGAFDVVSFNEERFMYLPRNGTINYGGYNYTVRSAEAIGGWMKVEPGITYWCWALSDDPYAYVTSVSEVPEDGLIFKFKVGTIE